MVGNYTKTPTQTILQYGLWAALVYVLFYYSIYMAGYETFAGGLHILPYWVTWGLVLYFAFRIRSQKGGYMGYTQALWYIFFIYAIAETVWGIFNYALYNWIDPNLPFALKEIAIGKMEEMGQMFKLSDSKQDWLVDEMERADTTLTFPAAIAGIFLYVFIGFGMSLFLAFFVKKEEPLFEE